MGVQGVSQQSERWQDGTVGWVAGVAGQGGAAC